MADLEIRVGDLNFSARWEAAAPRTIEAIRKLLPLEAKLIHCRWTGESTWIPFGDFRPGLDYENHTSHPAPGQLAIYPGGISECEYNGVEGGPARGEPFRERPAGRRLGRPIAGDGPALPLGGCPGHLDSRGRLMNWTLIVIVVVVVAVVLVLVALRGSFRNDDAFYDGSTLGGGRPTDNPESPPDVSKDVGADAGGDGTDREID
jgi:hypothetical protein